MPIDFYITGGCTKEAAIFARRVWLIAAGVALLTATHGQAFAAALLAIEDGVALHAPSIDGQCRLDPGAHRYDAQTLGYSQGSFTREHKVLALYESCDGLTERRRTFGTPPSARQSHILLGMFDGQPGTHAEVLAQYDAAAAANLPLLPPNSYGALQDLIDGYARPFAMGVGMPAHQTLAVLWQGAEGHAYATIMGLRQPINGSHLMAQVFTTVNVEGYFISVETTSTRVTAGGFYDLLAETLAIGSAMRIIRQAPSPPDEDRAMPGQSPL